MSDLPGESSIYADVDDSLAFAEHLSPDDIEARLNALGDINSPGVHLMRASLLHELAISTPDTEGDAELLRRSRVELKAILADNTLHPRHQIRFKANLLMRYEDVSRGRAYSRLPTRGLRTALQAKLGNLTMDFLGDRQLRNSQYGQVSELVAITYLLDSELFPYLGSWREEANIRTADNHDIYTLHPHGDNRVKKTPGSVKFREVVESDEVVGLTIGRIAREVILGVPPYDQDDILRLDNWLGHARATRLAADIMVCHTIGDTLSDEDQEVKQRLSGKLQTLMVDFASRSQAPDYASNADMLRRERAAYERRRQAAIQLRHLKTPRHQNP